jgi:hypothetical protein
MYDMKKNIKLLAKSGINFKGISHSNRILRNEKNINEAYDVEI